MCQLLCHIYKFSEIFSLIILHITIYKKDTCARDVLFQALLICQWLSAKLLRCSRLEPTLNFNFKVNENNVLLSKLINLLYLFLQPMTVRLYVGNLRLTSPCISTLSTHSFHLMKYSLKPYNRASGSINDLGSLFWGFWSPVLSLERPVSL